MMTLPLLAGSGAFAPRGVTVRVDERTVRRYVEHLTDLDVPVESVRGRYGGYRLAPGYKMPPLMLTDEEALAVLLGLVAGRRAGLAGSAAAAGTAAAKLRRVLPRPLKSRLDALLETTEFTRLPAWTGTAAATASPSPQIRVLLTLAEAARDRHPVAIGYADRHGRRSERTLQPYGLVAHSGRWYVAGGDSASGDVRTFRLDRITELRVLPGTFGLPEGFDTSAHVLAGLAQAPYAHDVSVRIGGTAERIRSGFPEGLALVEECPPPKHHPGESWFRVRLRAERLDWIPAVLAGLGCPFVIERPDELRGLVRDLARNLAAYADAPSGGDLA